MIFYKTVTSKVTTRERLLQAAGNRFVRDGILQTRLEDIRRDAGVSVGALYHHFADKETLHAEAWLAALSDYQRGFLQSLEGRADAEAGVKAVVTYQLDWVVDNPTAAALLYGARPSGGEARSRIAAQNSDFFERVLAWWGIHAAYGSVRDDLDPDLLHALWLGAADSYCRYWLGGTSPKVPTVVGTKLAEAAWTNLKGESTE
jgi:AcrR family transcriptional regulator